MDEAECTNLCPGDDCPPVCEEMGFSNAMSGIIGSPISFTGDMFSDAQANFMDWGGVTLAAAFAIGAVLSMVFGR